MRMLWRKRPSRAAPWLALTLCGCAPTINTSEVKLDVPAHYSQAPGVETPMLDWWRSFHAPELTRLIDQGRKANLDIAAAVARIEQADAAARLAAVPLLPSLTANGSATRARSSAFDGRVPSFRNTFQGVLNASYEIDFWGKNRAAAQASEFSAVADRYDAETVRLSAEASIANVYFAILAARERQRIVGDNLKAANRVLDLINQRLAVGTATALDQAQQQAVVANLRAEIPPLALSAAQNTDALALLIGRAAPRQKPPGGKLMAARIPPVRPGLPSDLLIRRPDIAFAQASLSANSANLVAARAAFFPTFDLTAQGGFESLMLRTLLDPKNALISAASSVSQPIFDNGKLQANFDEVKGKQDELIADYKKAVLSAFSDVEKALASQRYEAELETLQRASLAASQRAYELSEQRLREGTVDLVTVLNTQTTLFNVEDQLVQTRLARLQAAVNLYQALGGGWPTITRPKPAPAMKIIR